MDIDKQCQRPLLMDTERLAVAVNTTFLNYIIIYSAKYVMPQVSQPKTVNKRYVKVRGTTRLSVSCKRCDVTKSSEQGRTMHANELTRTALAFCCDSSDVTVLTIYIQADLRR